MLKSKKAISALIILTLLMSFALPVNATDNNYYISL